MLLATKCGRSRDNTFDFSACSVENSAMESMRRLRTDYLDLLQLHDVEFGDEDQIVNEGA